MTVERIPKRGVFVLKYEFREGVESYLNQSIQILDPIIDFNNENEAVLKFFDQSIFLMSDSTQNMEDMYEQSLAVVLNSRQQIDMLLSKYDLDTQFIAGTSLEHQSQRRRQKAIQDRDLGPWEVLLLWLDIQT